MRRLLPFALLAALAAAPAAEATFPGSNGRIAAAGIVGSGGDSTEALVTLPPEGRGRGRGVRFLRECTRQGGEPVEGSECDSDYRSPAWAPNGRRLVFDAGRSLALLSASGRDFELLPATSANDGAPSFSANGRRIAFEGRSGRSTSVFVRRVSGGRAQRLVRGASAPDWSRRNRIAYVRRGAIFTVRPNGRRRERVIRGRDPSWSPSGRSIAFSRRDGIYVVRADGRRLRRVLRCRDCDTPVFSPDGKLLVIDLKGLRTIRVRDGRLVRRLIDDARGSDFSEPTWQAR